MHYHKWVAPFGNLRIKAYLQLPEAFRSLSRPSSSSNAQASTIRPYSFNHHFCYPNLMRSISSIKSQICSCSLHKHIPHYPVFKELLLRDFVLSKLSKTFLAVSFLSPQKGGDPSPRSRRDTLLRLHPNHLSYLKWPPPKRLGYHIRVLQTFVA